MDIVLKQLDEHDIRALLNSKDHWQGLRLADDAVPPKHVFERSLNLTNDGVESIWSMPYLMVDKCTDMVVGCCGFKAAPVSGVVEVGYNVSSAIRGKGIATLALKLLSARAFESTQVMTVEALILSENIPSLRVVSKCGFEYIHVIPDGDNVGLECWQLTKDNGFSIL
ncbi:GNAT family N-acetyltransferase [Aliivibrio kagoshimensis]|uniref:GNAT family N-acetyltransferase n=1 Tax=Aliivibrio kagoshimensis TaxID=2910230 RepID=UPI003D0C8CD8